MSDALKSTDPNDQRDAAIEALFPFMQEVMRFAMGNGITTRQFMELTELAAVVAARRDLEGLGISSRSNARVSLRTGLSRKRVGELLRGYDSNRSSIELTRKEGIVQNVLAGWHMDKTFVGRDRKPLPLRKENGGLCFADLVAKYAPDHSPLAVLAELSLADAVAVRRGYVLPTQRAYVPKASSIEQIKVGARALRDLTRTITYNCQDRRSSGIRLLQRTVFERIPVSKTPEFYEESQRASHEYLTKMNAIMFNLRADRVQGEESRRVAVGVYQSLDE